MRDLSSYQAHYRDLPFEEEQARFRKLKILESMSLYRPRSILEVGCGLDSLFNHYKHFEQFVIVEPGADFVEAARTQAGSRSNVLVIEGTIEQSIDELSTFRYDFIVLSSLLHEVSESEVVLHAVAQLCQAATVVHVNVPNAHSLHRLLAYEMGLIGSIYEHSATQLRMQQSHVFDIERLNSLATRCGFRVLDQGTFLIKPFTHTQMAALRSTGLLTDLMLDGLYKLSKHLPDNGSEIFMNLRLRD